MATKNQDFQAKLRKLAEALLKKKKKTPFKHLPNSIELLHELNVHQVELEMQNEELRRAQAELEESRNLYIELYDFAPVSYFTLDQHSHILAVNFAGAELLGLERIRLHNKSFVNFIPITSRPTFQNHIKQLFKTRLKQVCEMEILQKGHSERFYVQIESMVSKNGHAHTTITNITSLKQTSLKLIELSKSLRLVNNLFQCASDAMAVLDEEFYFVIFNGMFEKMFSKIFTTKIKSGMSLFNTLINFPVLQNKIATACNRTFSNKKGSLIIENTAGKNTDYYCYEMHFSPIQDEDSQNIKSMILIRDITEHKLNEQKRFKRQAELGHVARMNAMGEMAAALAHEINQPLATINTYSQGCIIKLQEGMAEANNLLSILQKITTQSEHAGEIIHRMKNFMRAGTIYPEKVDINKLITDALVFMHYELENDALNVHLELSENLPNIWVDRVQITQVVLNLVRNSIEAIQSASIVEPKIIIRTQLTKADIEVDIVDNGPGILPEITTLILNSYFTTKPQGTGLGLAICRTLLEAHGGTLRIQTTQEKGAWIQFSLPIKSSHVNDNT